MIALKIMFIGAVMGTISGFICVGILTLIDWLQA